MVLTGLVSQLGGGETIQLIFNFAEAGRITLAVPVEPHAYEYATYAPPPTPSPPPPATVGQRVRARLPSAHRLPGRLIAAAPSLAP